MKDQELIGKVRSAVYQQCQNRGYAAPADVLVDVGVLSKQKYEERYINTPFPGFVWVCEVYLKEDYPEACIGEVIIDATFAPNVEMGSPHSGSRKMLDTDKESTV